MCDPVSGTLAVVSAVTAAVGGGLTAYSQHRQGKAANQAARMQAQQYADQAATAHAQAQVAQIQGEHEAERRYRILSQDIGSMYAQFAGNGLDVTASGGTVADALKTTVSEGLADVSSINANTRMNVWGHLADATQLRNQSSITAFQGKTAQQAGTLGAIGTGIGTIGSTVSAGISGAQAGKNVNKAFGWYQ